MMQAIKDTILVIRSESKKVIWLNGLVTALILLDTFWGHGMSVFVTGLTYGLIVALIFSHKKAKVFFLSAIIFLCLMTVLYLLHYEYFNIMGNWIYILLIAQLLSR